MNETERANLLRQQWRKEVAKDHMREMNIDEQRLNEAVKKDENKNG